MKKFIKNSWSRIKKIDWSDIILCVCFALIFLFCAFGICIEARGDSIQGKCIVVIPKVKQKPVLTAYTIKVDGKVYPIYRGTKGGLYYIKDGDKVYLTKKQKLLITNNQ